MMATARAAPMATAATPRGTRLSVATATTTRTSTKAATASAATTRPAETPAAGVVAPRRAIARARLRSSWWPCRSTAGVLLAVRRPGRGRMLIAFMIMLLAWARRF
jgi:hypothetical protein